MVRIASGNPGFRIPVLPPTEEEVNLEWTGSSSEEISLSLRGAESAGVGWGPHGGSRVCSQVSLVVFVFRGSML